MNDLNKYYTAIGRACLDLLKYYEADIKKNELAGVDDPERKEKYAFLEMSRGAFERNAQFRQEMAEKKSLVTNLLITTRTEITCSECNAKIVAEIIGEVTKQVVDGPKLKFDILVCPICNAEIEHNSPNNYPDLITFADIHIKMVNGVINNPRKYPMREIERQKMIKGTIEVKKSRDVMAEQIKNVEHDMKIIDEIDKVEKEMYDDWAKRKELGILWDDMDTIIN